MTKRYTYHKSEITGLFVISDEKHRETFSGMEEEYNCMRIVRKLNTLTDENEQLKQERQLLYENIDFFKKFIEKQGFKVKLDDKLFRVI